MVNLLVLYYNTIIEYSIIVYNHSLPLSEFILSFPRQSISIFANFFLFFLQKQQVFFIDIFNIFVYFCESVNCTNRLNLNFTIQFKYVINFISTSSKSPCCQTFYNITILNCNIEFLWKVFMFPSKFSFPSISIRLYVFFFYYSRLHSCCIILRRIKSKHNMGPNIK